MPKILKTNKKNEKKNKIYLYFFSSFKGLMLFFAGLLISGLFVLKSSGDSVFYFVFVFVIMGSGAFVTGFSAYRKIRERGFVNGIVSSAMYMGFIFVFVIALMRFNISANILIVMPVCLISGFLGGTVGANT